MVLVKICDWLNCFVLGLFCVLNLIRRCGAFRKITVKNLEILWVYYRWDYEFLVWCFSGSCEAAKWREERCEVGVG